MIGVLVFLRDPTMLKGDTWSFNGGKRFQGRCQDTPCSYKSVLDPIDIPLKRAPEALGDKTCPDGAGENLGNGPHPETQDVSVYGTRMQGFPGIHVRKTLPTATKANTYQTCITAQCFEVWQNHWSNFPSYSMVPLFILSGGLPFSFPGDRCSNVRV